MKIKVIASNPQAGQDEIKELIGKEFKTDNTFDRVRNEGCVDIVIDGYIYELNPSEYEVLEG